jgi:acyl-coenzyme A synthetase/AMP-(fatty) acid ligase
MSLFWLDKTRDLYITYEDLVTQLNEREQRHPIIYNEDPSEVFIEILLAILCDTQTTLLDPNFSEETLSSLGYGTNIVTKTVPASNIQIDNPDELVTYIENANEQWKLTLYTSGTTGMPSAVDQTLEGLTRSVRQSDRFSEHVWAFAYNPTHFAGLQVFFQALLNQNDMIYIFESSSENVGDLIDQYGITHISATPTFYRLRLQQLSGVYDSVVRLTSGGEKFEPSLQESLKEIFPNAEFRNVYAITEAGSLLESNGELFKIPNELSGEIQITGDNELVVHKSLLGQSVSDTLDGEWFYTGDLIEYVDDDRFRFVGRESDFVNVGGYRVNPHEVERQINTVDEINATVVSARESSVTGNILVAEIQPVENVDPDVAKNEVKDRISTLERWKQPQIINVVDNIDQSRSGKRIRNKEK